jgi:hypothetical protein
MPRAHDLAEILRIVSDGARLVDGFATLWLNGALPDRLGNDPEAAARAVARLLFGAS